MADEEQEVTTAPDVETEAREMGWVPKEEWKKNADDWKPAEDFVKRGKEILPIVNAQLRTERDKVKRLEQALEKTEKDFDKRVVRLEKATQEALKRQRDQIERDFESRKEKAVETGDTEGYKAAVKAEKVAMEKLADKAEVAEEKEDKADKPKLSEAQEKWIEENDWYGKDKTLTRWADTFAHDVEDDMPAASEKKKLAEIRARLEEKFPDKFGVEEGRKSSRVEGGSRVGGGPGKFSGLPAEAKTAMERDIKAGFYKDTQAGREEWLRVYNS